jgi:hypothetical protein
LSGCRLNLLGLLAFPTIMLLLQVSLAPSYPLFLPAFQQLQVFKARLHGTAWERTTLNILRELRLLEKVAVDYTCAFAAIDLGTTFPTGKGNFTTSGVLGNIAKFPLAYKSCVC